MNEDRARKFEKVKEIGAYCSLILWLAGVISFVFFHKSGWWVVISFVASWALYYLFIRGYIERKYFSE
jgi:hypothetical protein